MKLVLLPGLDGTGQLFGPILRCFHDSVSAEVVSYPIDQQLDYSELSEFVWGLLPKDEPFALVGESFSSPISICLAARRPSLLRCLVVVCGFASSPHSIAPSFASVMERLPTRGTVARIGSHFLLGAESPVTRERLDKAIESVAPEVLHHRLGQILQLDASQELKHIAVPMLYLRASRDRLVGKRAMEEFVRLTPDLQTRVVDGPHLLLQERAEECADLISEFVLQRAAE